MARSILLKSKHPFLRGAAPLALGMLLGVSAMAAVASTPQQKLQEAWNEAAALRATDAHTLFESLHGHAGLPQREIAYGEALTLLDVQPKTDQNIAHAADLFAQLAQADPDDQIGQEARFFLARIAQTHQRPADPAKAEQLYRALFHDHPESVVGQLALEKAALVGLFANAPAAEIPARFDEFEKLGASLADPTVQAAFHLVMGMAALEFRLSPEKAYVHLAAAEKIGVPGAQAHATNLVRLGRLAQKLGQRQAQIAYWSDFVRLFPHDSRNYAIRQELAQLGVTVS